jgi:hypothetical protein
MPEKIVPPDPDFDPTHADLKWFGDLVELLEDHDGEALAKWESALTPRERDRWWQCLAYLVRRAAEAPEMLLPDTRALLEEVQEGSRKLLAEMQACGALEITQVMTGPSSGCISRIKSSRALFANDAPELSRRLPRSFQGYSPLLGRCLSAG